jgi:hypothetical protein
VASALAVINNRVAVGVRIFWAEHQKNSPRRGGDYEKSKSTRETGTGDGKTVTDAPTRTAETGGTPRDSEDPRGNQRQAGTPAMDARTHTPPPSSEGRAHEREQTTNTGTRRAQSDNEKNDPRPTDEPTNATQPTSRPETAKRRERASKAEAATPRGQPGEADPQATGTPTRAAAETTGRTATGKPANEHQAADTSDDASTRERAEAGNDADTESRARRANKSAPSAPPDATPKPERANADTARHTKGDHERGKEREPNTQTNAPAGRETDTTNTPKRTRTKDQKPTTPPENRWHFQKHREVKGAGFGASVGNALAGNIGGNEVTERQSDQIACTVNAAPPLAIWSP